MSTFTTAFFIILSLCRLVRRELYIKFRLVPGKHHRVVIVGGGTVAHELASALKNDPLKKYSVVGILAPEMEEIAGSFPRTNAEETMSTLGIPQYLVSRRVDQIYFTLP